MEWISNFLNFIFETLLAEFVVVVAGVIVAHLILDRFDRWRYGNWRVVVRRDGGEVLRRDISPGKTKVILNQPEEKIVYLKGVASSYEWLTVDLHEEGRKIGLLQEDVKNRVFIIDLDKNPPKQAGILTEKELSSTKL